MENSIFEILLSKFRDIKVEEIQKTVSINSSAFYALDGGLSDEEKIVNKKREDLNKFIEIYNEIFSNFRQNNYPKAAELSFESEIEIFYNILLAKFNNIQYDEDEKMILLLFLGICEYVKNEYNLAFETLSVFKSLCHKNDIEFGFNVIDPLLSNIYKKRNKNSIYILLSGSSDGDDTYEKITKKKFEALGEGINNYSVTIEYANGKFNTMDELISETIKHSIVFFVGHGKDDFIITLESNNEPLTFKMIIDHYIVYNKRPLLLSLLSCAYDNYLPLAYSGLFQYFILSKNAGNEHSETFIKSFINSLDIDGDIEAAFIIGKTVMLTRFNGSKQVELFSK